MTCRAARADRGRAGVTIAAAALLLFLILDPLGNIPVFLSLLKGLPPARQRVVIVRKARYALRLEGTGRGAITRPPCRSLGRQSHEPRADC